MDAKFAVGAVLLIGVILIAGCTQQPQAEQTLKIGVVASMTGSASTTGKDIWQSAVLAVEE
nr:ABC transporter substrate-binding protein [Methanoregulaceae archaeon]